MISDLTPVNVSDAGINYKYREILKPKTENEYSYISGLFQNLQARFSIISIGEKIQLVVIKW